jgi:hypothetical protein
MKDYVNLIPIHLTWLRTRDLPGGSIEPYPLHYRAPQFLCFNGYKNVKFDKERINNYLYNVSEFLVQDV